MTDARAIGEDRLKNDHGGEQQHQREYHQQGATPGHFTAVVLRSGVHRAGLGVNATHPTRELDTIAPRPS